MSSELESVSARTVAAIPRLTSDFDWARLPGSSVGDRRVLRKRKTTTRKVLPNPKCQKNPIVIGKLNGTVYTCPKSNSSRIPYLCCVNSIQWLHNLFAGSYNTMKNAPPSIATPEPRNPPRKSAKNALHNHTHQPKQLRGFRLGSCFVGRHCCDPVVRGSLVRFENVCLTYHEFLHLAF